MQELSKSIMIQSLAISLLLICILTSCISHNSTDRKFAIESHLTQKNDTVQNMMTETEIIDHVTKAINPFICCWLSATSTTAESIIQIASSLLPRSSQRR